MPSRRRLARIAVMQTLFELEFSSEDPKRDPAVILDSNMRELGIEVVDTAFARQLLKGVRERMEEVQAALQEHAPQWPLERMDRISRAILMIGSYELLIEKEAPPAVVMNEAIEIAKEYGELESAKFVNGVLNAIAHQR